MDVDSLLEVECGSLVVMIKKSEIPIILQGSGRFEESSFGNGETVGL